MKLAPNFSSLNKTGESISSDTPAQGQRTDVSADLASGVCTSTFQKALSRDLETINRAGLKRTLRTVESRSGTMVRVEGRAREIVDFSSNDYLGLGGDERLGAAIHASISAPRSAPGKGIGAAAARLISGNSPLHTELENRLAELKGTEAALLFSSGYAANLGTISALVGKRDVVYSDEYNHASILDAIRLSRAETRVFPHLDTDALTDMLKEDTGKYRRRLIVVDGVFSMDGDLFPLDKLVQIAKEYDAWTYVDDAHATAIIGQNGRGTSEHFGVEGEIDVVMGTLGKSLGVTGAFVAGSAQLREFLIHRARSFMFTTSTPPLLAAASIEAINIAQAEPWRRHQLHENARKLRAALQAAVTEPITVLGPEDSFIIPVILGSSERTLRAGEALLKDGYFVGAVRPPSVPRGTSRLRITVNALHTEEQIDGLVTSLKRHLSIDI